MSDVEEEPQGGSFGVLDEKSLSSRVIISQWCTTMDIVVLVTENGQLQLFRLNWERLWSKQPESPITCVQWRPDGKQLAYGDENGDIFILSAEDGSVVEHRKVIGDGRKASALCWVQYDVSPHYSHVGAPLGYRAPQLLHSKSIEEEFNKSSEEPRYSNPILLDGNGQSIRSSMLTLVCAVDNVGNVVLCGEGLLPLLTFHIEGYDEKATHVSMAMSSNAEQASVSWRDAHGSLCLSTFDISAVPRQAVTLHTVGLIFSYTLRDIEMLYKIIQNIKDDVASVDESRDSHMSVLRDMIGGFRDGEKDIYDLMIRGYYSLELKNFVAKESDLKEAAKGVDVAISRVCNDIVRYLQPCLERISFRLGELRGYASSPMSKPYLGLKVWEVGKCEKRILNLLLLSEHLREVALKSARSHRKLYTYFAMLSARDLGDKYPSLSKASMSEIEDLITSGYFKEDLQSMLGAMVGEHDKDDQELLACIFKSQCEMKEDSMNSMGNIHSSLQESDANEQEEYAMFERVLHDLEKWLDGDESLNYVDRLIEESTEESVPYGIYGVDCFKAMFLHIISRPCDQLSSFVKTIHQWVLMPTIGSKDCLSILYDQEDNILVTFTCFESSSFCEIQIRDPTHMTIIGGSLPGESITECLDYKSESLLIASAVDGGSYLYMIPKTHCPYSHTASTWTDEIAHALQQEIEQSPIDHTVCRTLHDPSKQMIRPFASSSSRGVALAIFKPNHAVIYDLEDDGLEEDEMEESYEDDE
jgi:hypothetical protein